VALVLPATRTFRLSRSKMCEGDTPVPGRDAGCAGESRRRPAWIGQRTPAHHAPSFSKSEDAMQEQLLDRAGLNGSGPEPPPAPGLVPAVVAPAGARRVRTCRMAEIMADPAGRAEVFRRVTETTDSYAEIADALGVPRGTLQAYVARQDWPRPEGALKATVRADGSPVTRRRLAATIDDAGSVKVRLLRAVDRQIGKIETRLRKRGADIEDRDSRILGNLAKTLATLMAIGEGDATAREAEPVNREELEADLARRIKRWAEGGEGSQ
jgi:hypothetical protein